jgi:ketosteroid isomerase-like protein
MSQAATQSLAREVVSVFNRDHAGASAKIAEQKNVQIIQQLYDAFLRRDVVALLDGMDEDVEWRIDGPAEVPFTGAARGHQEVARALQRSFATVRDQQPEIRHVIAEGDTVTVHGFERGKHLPTGNPYAASWTHVFTLRDGKVVRFHEEFDHAPILETMRAGKDVMS